MEILNLFRVGTILALVYLVLPLYVTRFGGKYKTGWLNLVGPVFLRTALFVQISVIALGQWRLCLPGTMGALYFFWILANTWHSYHSRWMYQSIEWKYRWSRILKRLEPKTGKGPVRVTSISPQSAIAYVLISFIFLQTAGFPVANLRFLTQESYGRALSIGTLLQGSTWTYEGSIPLLIPAAFWTGLDAATVVRLSGPILLLALLFACWHCVKSFGGSWRSAFFAISIFWIASRWFQLNPGEENTARDLAALFLLLAISHLRTSYGYAAISLLLVVMVNPQLDAAYLCPVLAVFAGLAMEKLLVSMPTFLSRPATTGLLLAAGLPAVIGAGPRFATEPLQYESAARAVYEIAAQFPRNQWTIVSPGNELAQIYGRGWHVQLSEFTRRHRLEQVSRSDFEFPYPTGHVFVFVEKKPLPVKAMAIYSNGDEAAYNYATQSGRIALEYQAAELMAAYVGTHPRNVSVFGEDDDLIVYHVQPTPTKVTK